MLDSHVTVDDVEVLDEKRDGWMISREDDGMICIDRPVGAAVDSTANSQERKFFFFGEKGRKACNF